MDLALRKGQIDPKLSKILIVLLPKVQLPANIKNIRPISLCNVAYTLVTKVVV